MVKRQGRFTSNLTLEAAFALLERELDNIVKNINNPATTEAPKTGIVKTSVNAPIVTDTPTNPEASVSTNSIKKYLAVSLDSLQLVPIWRDLAITDLNTTGYLIGQIPDRSMIMFLLVVCDAELDGLTKFEITDGTNVIVKDSDVDYSRASFNMCAVQYPEVINGKSLILNNTGTVVSGTAKVLILYVARTN